MRLFFPFIKDGVARDSIKAIWQRNIAALDEHIAYLEGVSQTHMATYKGFVPVAELLQEAKDEKVTIQAEIDKLV